MKKIYSIFIVVLILSSCFHNNDNVEDNVESNIIENIDTDKSLDEEIQMEEKTSQELEGANEEEIDELINTIIE